MLDTNNIIKINTYIFTKISKRVDYNIIII